MGGIDNACHVGGLISGAILGALVARLAPQPDAPARRVSVLAVVALVVLACGFGVREWRGRPMRMAMALSALQKDGADSTAQLRELVRQEPNSAEAHSQLGQVYYSRHQFSDAATEFKRVLELRPESVGAQFNLGMSYFEDKRADDAKSTFTQMIQRNAKSPGGHYGMGLVLANQGQYKAAIDEFKASAADGQSIQGLYYEIGNCYAKLNQYDDAIAAYIKERQQDGDDPDLENALAQAYEAKGMAQQAQEARTKAAQLASGTAQ
jgi:predicted Zn-dependent protease